MSTDTLIPEVKPQIDEQEASITITASAAAQVMEIINRENATDLRLRIGVMGGGCSGLEYYIGLDADLNEGDEVFQQDGFEMVIDADSADYLKGASLDFANDFQNSGFIFNNPNASRSCGCGKSFCG